MTGYDKELDELLFSQEYPLKMVHLKDCPFVWQDEGICRCDTEIPKAKAKLNSLLRRVEVDSRTDQIMLDELSFSTEFSPPVSENEIMDWREQELKALREKKP